MQRRCFDDHRLHRLLAMAPLPGGDTRTMSGTLHCVVSGTDFADSAADLSGDDYCMPVVRKATGLARPTMMPDDSVL